MKKLLFVVLASLLLFGCQKKDENVNLTQDVVFSINKVDPESLLKSTSPPDCPTDDQGNLLVPNYAEITINGDVYSPDVFELDGKLYTQAIKFPALENNVVVYTVENFLLFNASGTLIMATPSNGGAYAEYVDKTVDFTFEVNAFEKAEVAVEVLCYLPENHDYFGFTWFEITQIAVREFCFFGDICLNGDSFTPEDFEGSLYGTDLGIDVPAIMQIVVKKGGVEVPNSPFNNETASLTGPLCVQYPDKLNVPDEVFTFEVYLWLPDASGFSYQLYATCTSTDDGDLDIDDGGDGIIDFVVGTCGYEGDADQTFDWIYLPPCLNQGYEVDTEGWIDLTNGWYGTVARVASGTDGITSSMGSWHAIFDEDASSAPFTRFCGYSDTWTGTWSAETDVYLDLNWSDGEGFDFTVATCNSSGTHLRDFIWHVGRVADDGNGNSELIVNASNNTDATFNPWKLVNENEGNFYTITGSGWYTFKTEFTDVGGALAVNFKLYNASGVLLHTITRSTPTDLIPSVVGGNRYGWFTFISVDGGIALDETKMYR